MPRFGHVIRGEGHRYPLCKRLGSYQSQSGRMWRRQNFFAAARFETQTNQPVANRYISCAIQAHTVLKCLLISLSHFPATVFSLIFLSLSWDSLVDIVTILWAGRPKILGKLLERERDFSVLEVLRNLIIHGKMTYSINVNTSLKDALLLGFSSLHSL